MRIDTQTVAQAVIMIPHSWLIIWLFVNVLYAVLMSGRPSR